MGDRSLIRIASILLVTSAFAAFGVTVYAQSDSDEAEPLRVSALSQVEFDQNFTDMKVVQIEGVDSRGYGDPAAGCYAAAFRIALPPNAGIDRISAGVISALRTNFFEVREGIADSADYGDAVTFSLSNETMNGIATLALSKSGPLQANLLACYWNDRTPNHCAAICTASLGAKARK